AVRPGLADLRGGRREISGARVEGICARGISVGERVEAVIAGVRTHLHGVVPPDFYHVSEELIDIVGTVVVTGVSQALIAGCGAGRGGTTAERDKRNRQSLRTGEHGGREAERGGIETIGGRS